MANTTQNPARDSISTAKASPWLLGGGIAVIIILVYSRLFSAGFAGLDDDINVYANPYLNPPTLASVEALWLKPYEGLYVPLAYTLFALIAHFSQMPATFIPAMGQVVTVAPEHFHAVNIFVHVANSILVFMFLRNLAKNPLTAFVCALLFALHPLQTESVAWISELRGLSGSFFALVALNLFTYARRLNSAKASKIMALFCATLSLICGMLCKPSIVALPLVTLAIDRIVFQTDWRRSLTLAAIWIACTVPFLAITHSIQVIDPLGSSQVWQRPFVAGDALAFYIGKILTPINLGVDYGRTPSALFSRWWSYLTWVLPVTLFVISYRARKSRPLIFLGTIIFVMFLLPVLGLVPFSFQRYSTVSDRYVYLSLIGIALIVMEAIESVNIKLGAVTVGAVCVIYGGLSFYQTQFWMNERAFLAHSLDVNPSAAFAYDHLGVLDFGSRNVPVALQDFLTSERLVPNKATTDINIAACYLALGERDKTTAMLYRALKEPGMSADNWSKLARIFGDIHDNKNALLAYTNAIRMAPADPAILYSYAKALNSAGEFSQAQSVFQQCIQAAPNMAQARVGLGVVYGETGHLREAESQFADALDIDPNNQDALKNYKLVQQMQASSNTPSKTR